MEDLNRLFELTETYPMQLEEMADEFLSKLRLILWGQVDGGASSKEKSGVLPTESPLAMKNRIKQLSLLNENMELEEKLENFSPGNKAEKISLQKSKLSNVEQLAVDGNIEDINKATKNEAFKATMFESSAKRRFEKEINRKIVSESEDINLMPPPPAPLPAFASEMINKRPQRSARIKCEQNLKEPKLSTKLRRPTTNELKIKLEQEQGQSQMYEAAINTNTSNTSYKSSNEEVVMDSQLTRKPNDSVFLIPGKQGNMPKKTLASNNNKTAKEQISERNVDSTESEIHIKIKREKVNLEIQEKIDHLIETVLSGTKGSPQPISLAKNETKAAEETSMASSVLSSTDTATGATTKKTHKKKHKHKPIKVERFSDLDAKHSPISSRTRHCSISKTNNKETSQSQGTERPASVYEDTNKTPTSDNSNKAYNAIAKGGITNETTDLGPSADATFSTNPAQVTFQVAPSQTTFVVDSNPNATVTLNKHSDTALPDATFVINQESKTGEGKEDNVAGQRSFVAAKDSLMHNDGGIMNKDEHKLPVIQKSNVRFASIKAKGVVNISDSAETAAKMPTQPKALFNPLVQSPVKLRVEAFENAAVAELSKRPLRNRKENFTRTSTTTPVIAKLKSPALGRFLTPTQASNIIPSSSDIAKKGTSSASKALPQSTSVSSLIRSNSPASTKALPHKSSSGDDFRKGLYKLAEERKKQREQKHLLAAQQREAKERERAERVAKVTKEREEKRLLKNQQEQEQKRELKEIQRKLRQQQGNVEKVKSPKERDILQMNELQQLAKPKMMPSSKYTFEMLHEDDSTDDKNKASYKRPPLPSWSRSDVRGPIMLRQEYTPAAYIDSFFSVQPMTPDLKIIFPDIDARHLQRNSSVIWSTPPRYSELPKY